MFARAGESVDGSAPPERCPGEDSCGKFAIAKSETGDGEDACVNCHLRETKNDADFNVGDEVEEMIFRTSQIIEAEDAGFKTDWEFYGPDLAELVIEYRRAEKALQLLFNVRHQQFIRAHFSKG